MVGDPEYEWPGGVTARRGSAVHGERRWLTSERAELSVLIGVELSDWGVSVVLWQENEATADSGCV